MVNHRFLVFSIQTPRWQNPTNPTKRTSRFLDGMSARRSNLWSTCYILSIVINCYQWFAIEPGQWRVCVWPTSWPARSFHDADCRMARWLREGATISAEWGWPSWSIMRFHIWSIRRFYHILIYLIWSQPPNIIGNRSTNSTFHQTFWGVFSVSPSWSTSYGRWAMAAGQIVPSLGAPQDADAK